MSPLDGDIGHALGALPVSQTASMLFLPQQPQRLPLTSASYQLAGLQHLGAQGLT